jgi:hypothetical protein
MPVMNKWLVIPKVGLKQRFARLFVSNDPDEVTTFVEDKVERFIQVLTTTQRTADWFTLRTFHLTATMASNILSMQSNKDDSNNTEDITILFSLLNSCFNRARSTEPMVIGSHNVDAVLLNLYKKRIYS